VLSLMALIWKVLVCTIVGDVSRQVEDMGLRSRPRFLTAPIRMRLSLVTALI
jgi:hypothetical protein